MKFEDVEKQLKKVDLKTLQAPRDRAAAQASLCGIWLASKSVVLFLSSFPFFPAKWLAVLKQLVGTLDLICPDPAPVPAPTSTTTGPVP